MLLGGLPGHLIVTWLLMSLALLSGGVMNFCQPLGDITKFPVLVWEWPSSAFLSVLGISFFFAAPLFFFGRSAGMRHFLFVSADESALLVGWTLQL